MTDKKTSTLEDLGEFGLIERIRQSATSDRTNVYLGIGDDCAAVRAGDGNLLLTSTDLLLENIHFRLDWTDWFQLGRKCISVNVSDIAAMGGTPRHVFLGLALPPSLPTGDLDRFFAGVASAATDYEVTLLGGDTCRSDGPAFVSVTVQGEIPENELVTRAGAHVGDDLYVTGTLGDSAAALWLLQTGQPVPEHLARRHHDPTARCSFGRQLARRRLATAMLDISDGLLGDLGHLLDASAVGARVDAASLPLSAALAALLDEDSERIELALQGGEDYELLFSAPPRHAAAIGQLAAETGLPARRIGTLTADRTERRLTDRTGREVTFSASSFNHFRKNMK